MHRAGPALLVATFALAVGHLAWNAAVGPPVAADYFIGGQVDALVGPNPAAKHLYLRRQLYLSQRPRHAWVRVLARDHVTLYVNGQLVAQESLDEFQHPDPRVPRAL